LLRWADVHPSRNNGPILERGKHILSFVENELPGSSTALQKEGMKFFLGVCPGNEVRELGDIRV
jgi:hypothetical protein